MLVYFSFILFYSIINDTVSINSFLIIIVHYQLRTTDLMNQRFLAYTQLHNQYTMFGVSVSVEI
jgi:hypothetical protein